MIIADGNYEIVRRSNAKLQYGRNLIYSESMVPRSFSEGVLVLFSLLVLIPSMLVAPTRWFLLKFVLTQQGSGPSEEILENGYGNMYGVGTGTKGTKVHTVLRFNKDVGYKDTARMLAESCLTLTLGDGRSDVKGGWWTSAEALGEKLLDRLKKTGCTFSYYKP